MAPLKHCSTRMVLTCAYQHYFLETESTTISYSRKRNTVTTAKSPWWHQRAAIKHSLGNSKQFKDVRANCFCPSLLRTKFTRHVMHRVRALSSKVNNNRANGHSYMTLRGFNGLGRLVTPYFSFDG